MKIRRGTSKKLMAVVLLAALIALLLAAPVSSNHTCKEGTDDYAQCVALTKGDEQATDPYGAAQTSYTPWHIFCDDPSDEDSCP